MSPGLRTLIGPCEDGNNSEPALESMENTEDAQDPTKKRQRPIIPKSLPFLQRRNLKQLKDLLALNPQRAQYPEYFDERHRRNTYQRWYNCIMPLPLGKLSEAGFFYIGTD